MKLRLTSRIILFFVLMAGAILAVVGLLSYRSGSESLQQAAISEMVSMAVEKEAALDAWIGERLTEIQRLSSYGDVVEKAAALVAAEPATDEARTARMALLQELQPYASGVRSAFIELFVMNPRGEVVVSTDPRQEWRSKQGQPYFEHGRTALYVQAPYRSQELKAPAMTAAVPLRDREGRVVAILAVQWNLAVLNEIAQRRTGLHETVDAFLVNEEGYPVTQPRFLREPAVLRVPLETDAVQRCLARQSGVSFAPDYRGVPCLAVYRWNSRHQLGLILAIDQVDALAPAHAFGRQVVLISGFALLAAAGLAYLLARTITRPLRTLREGVRRFAQGATGELALDASGDEVGLLATEFKAMAARVVERTDELAQSNAALQRQKTELQALFDVMPAMVIVKDAANVLVRVNQRFADSIGRTVEEIEGKTSVEIFGEEQAALHDQDDAEVIRTGLAKLGAITLVRDLHGHEFWVHVDRVPVCDQDGTVQGVIIAGHDITARHEAELALSESRQILRLVLDTIPVRVFWKDSDSVFQGCNLPFALDAGLRSIEEVAGKDDRQMAWANRAEAYRADDRLVMETGRPRLNYDEPQTGPDGRTGWLRTSKVPLRDAGGNITGLLGTYEDITARREAEAALEKAHRDLIGVSRQAGMAEVATTVLHNVGNVLNSVNVSASLAGERIRGLGIVDVSRIAALLEEHADDLPGYFARDPRAATIPGYLAKLGAHFMAEQEAILKEFASLAANIEHIKEIVTMQQSYARVAGVAEVLAPAELVEDALRLNAAALERHAVEVIREYAGVPPIAVDKHKVIQVLVNLIRNAMEACDDRGGTDKRLWLRLAHDGAGRTTITVADNGVGIAAEHLTRIFEYGFTTRAEGHGWGLHSGANAARELGGSLHAASPGPGRGATFTLELPGPPWAGVATEALSPSHIAAA